MSLKTQSKKYIRAVANRFGLDIVRLPSAPQNAAGHYPWLQLLTSTDVDTVIDVGAHTGEFALLVHKAKPQVNILSFEPLTDEFRQLQHNMRHVSGFTAFNYALGEVNTSRTIYRNDFSPSSSLLPMANLLKVAFPFAAIESPQRVEVRRLDDLLTESQLGANTLMKIDVQGYEDRVILGANRTLARTATLIVEISFFQLYQDQPLFHDVYELLHAKGFKYKGSVEQLRNPVDGTILQADAIFEKE